jgi:hypothetical protein
VHSSEGVDTKYIHAALSCSFAECLGEISGASGMSIPDEDSGCAFTSLPGQRLRFFKNQIIGCGVRGEFAGTFGRNEDVICAGNLVYQAVIKRPPISRPIGDGCGAEAIAIERQNHAASDTEASGLIEQDQIGSACGGRDNQLRVLVVKEAADALRHQLDVAQRKAREVRTWSIDSPPGSRKYHLRSILPDENGRQRTVVIFHTRLPSRRHSFLEAFGVRF